MDKLAPTLYDIIGYVIPGLLLCYSSLLFYKLYIDISFTLNHLWFSNSLVLILFAYFVGQIVQAFAGIIIKTSVNALWSKSNIDDNFKMQILHLAKEKIKSKIELTTLTNDTAEFMEFNVDSEAMNKLRVLKAVSGFCRGLSLVFFAISAELFIASFSNKEFNLSIDFGHDKCVMILRISSVVAIALGLVFINRYNRFKIRALEALAIGFYAKNV